MNHDDSPARGRPLVPLGKILITPGALRTLALTDVRRALARHLRCDWGDVCDDDASANDASLTDGTRLLSVYHDRRATRFWIITEADRSATTILLPDEY